MTFIDLFVLFGGVGSLLSLCEFRGWNLGHQARWNIKLSAKPSCQPLMRLIIVID